MKNKDFNYVSVDIVLNMLSNPALRFVDARIDSNSINFLKYLGYKIEDVRRFTRVYNRVMQ